MASIDLEQARARTAFAGEQGRQWVERKKTEMDALPAGTVVVINVVSGEYVSGPTWLEAHKVFEQRFGRSTLGYVHRIGERTFVGGGIG